MEKKLEQTRWQAVLDRDRAADGAFVYAVQSTGVYCRPICPSRRPRPDQVLFFDRPEEAEGAGYRACRRCKPKDADNLIGRLCLYIQQHADEPVTLAELAKEARLSPFHVQRVFKKATGVTPREYWDALRLGRLKTHLKNGSNVTEALYEAGYGSSSRLYDRAATKLGMTPSVYRRGASGIVVRYTIAASPLGRLLVAATEKGICSVKMGDADAALENTLYAEFPNALVERDSAGLTRFVRTILRHLAGDEPRLDLPTDLRATAFQTRVWQELRRIPYGETRSYAQIARAVGRPKAARAVARACASNPAALVIPCHRVVRGDGDTGGYRWGEARKKQLLAREAIA